MADAKDKKPSFKDTLNLPRTDFPIRANAKENDPKTLEKWEKERICSKTFDANKGAEKFILHDGPPYANGHIHLGHAYNKILKDFVAKVHRMLGKHVPITPGWDCHGLPIEWAVDKANPGISKSDLKKKCREFANKWVSIQKEEFKKLGVFMDWENPYLTMSPDFEASILRAFAEFVKLGYIERKNKSVPWCASCKTVLATAEIEYQDRKDPSIYVLFELAKDLTAKVFPELKDKKISLLAWTTTPWTLPLNRAIFLRPKTKYQVLEHEDTFFIVAKELADVVCQEKKIEKKVVAEIESEKLVGSKAKHPFVENLFVPVLSDGFVGLDEGTACVHSAPGCGPEDYEMGIKNDLEIFSPLSEDGKYAVGIEPKELEGMPVADGNGWVIKKLIENERLLCKTSIKHPYPHCWRCRNPLIFRATKQWFCNLSKGGLRKKALEAIEKIEFIPKSARSYLRAAVGSRLEWCLSRQRVWGAPIPAAICKSCNYAFTGKDFIESVAKNVETDGIEYWDSVELKALLPKDFKCPDCGKEEFRKEEDILDVWFESGITHYAVLKDNPKLGYPSDIFIEALDQNRGWFQSSLLTSLVLEEKPCTKCIDCHGFTVDKDGRKMSKSLGNVIAPQQVINKVGTDGLRLWVSCIEPGKDLICSEQLLANVSEVYRKIRNTCRFLLSNLYDFDKEKDGVEVEDLFAIDQYALTKIADLNEDVQEYYSKADFTGVFHALADYCSVELSSFYLDIVKDRLYVEQADGKKRRSTQTACWYILDTLTRLIAPILSFAAEQISDGYQKNKTQSIHLQQFGDLGWIWKRISKEYISYRPAFASAYNVITSSTMDNIDIRTYLEEKDVQWSVIKTLRSALLKTIENQRQQGLIKHSLEAKLRVFIDLKFKDKDSLGGFFRTLRGQDQSTEQFLKELMIVSQVEIVKSKDGLEKTELPGLFAKVEKADGQKCPRCWHWSESKNKDHLCDRCEKIVK